MLKNRSSDYLERYTTPKTVFCRRVNISTTALRRYLNDELVFAKGDRGIESQIILINSSYEKNKTENVLIGTNPQ